MRLSRTITAPTARRGQVERVATSWAIRMKYSSQEGRTFFSAACSFVVSTEGSLKRSIQPISRVAKARNNKRPIVQLRVYGGCVEPCIGMFSGHTLDAGRSGYGVQAADPTRPVLFQLAQS